LFKSCLDKWGCPVVTVGNAGFFTVVSAILASDSGLI
jgi:hypothetical protein